MRDYERERARELRWAAGNFERALRMMRRRNGLEAEEGFLLLQDMAERHVDDLIREFEQEQDGGNRAWLLELIGHARSPRAFAVLAAVLDSDDDHLMFWAERGLRLLDIKEARRLLWQHELNKPIG